MSTNETLASTPQWLLRPTQTPQVGSVGAIYGGSPILEGERNGTLFSIAGKLRREGTSEAEILSVLQQENSKRCSPPLDDGEVAKIARSASKYDPVRSSHGPSKKAVEPYRLYSVGDLSSLPPLQWLVDGVLPANSLCVIYGQPGTGKTFVALDLALSIAEGSDAWGDTHHGGVVYVAAEGTGGLKGRISAWLKTKKVEDQGKIHFVRDAVPVNDEQCVDAFLATLAQLSESPRLVVVDTLARCNGGSNENDASEMGVIIRQLDRIREATGATVLVIHHSTKEGRAERGSSALRGACDMMALVEQKRDIVTLRVPIRTPASGS